DVLTDTGLTSQWMTEAMYLKQSAADCLLAGAQSNAPALIAEACSRETNPYLVSSLLKLISCFQIDFAQLPGAIKAWVAEPYDAKRSDPSGEAARRIASLAVASASATPDALSSLLNFGFTFAGAVLRETSRSVAECALALHENGVEG